jgi:hypothetical protein
VLRQPAPRRSPAAAVLHARSRIEITAGDVSLQRLQAREGAHLIVRAEKEVDLSDAEFLRSSILAAATATPPLPDREDPGERPPDSTASAEARWKAQKERFDLARRLAEQLGPAEVVSLRRAIVADLVLSGVRLDRCGFAGAHVSSPWYSAEARIRSTRVRPGGSIRSSQQWANSSTRT